MQIQKTLIIGTDLGENSGREADPEMKEEGEEGKENENLRA